MTTDTCEFALDVSLEARCIRCRILRDVCDAEMILQESSSDTRTVKASCVVVTPTACECGERRVRAKATVGIE